MPHNITCYVEVTVLNVDAQSRAGKPFRRPFSAAFAALCRVGEWYGVDMVAKVPVHGCRFYVVVGRMQCASARALESGLLLPAEQPHGWGQCIRSARLLE